MEQKDPKDMTASELVRWAGNGEEHISPIDGNSWTAFSAKLKSVVEVEIGDWPNDERLCDYLADKIDAELAQARELSLLRGAELWAMANGWPDFRDGEDFGAWLDRCALPRPRFEDGEVVGVREYEDIQGYCVYDDGEFFITTPNRSIDYAAGDRVKRPAPEALGADGLPIKAGETVWDIYGRGPIAVKSISRDSDGNPVVWSESQEFAMPNLLTHTPPDTQERIDEDARKSMIEYWRCSCIECDNCPSVIDGKKPNELYGTGSSFAGCSAAMMLDLLRRQRELDKRTGGAE